MKKIIYTLAISLSTFGLFAQTTETRTVDAFTKIEAGGAAKVVINQGSEQSVKVKAESSDMSKIITEVKGGTLYIKTKDEIKEDVEVSVTYKDLESITTGGAAYLRSDTTLSFQKLELDATGAAKIKLDIITKTLTSTVSGAATISLSGAAEEHNTLVSGAATLKAYKLSTMKTVVQTSGASTAKVNANSKISASASGASTIKYMGNAEDKVINLSGAADIKQVDSNEATIALNDSDTTNHNHGYRHFNDNDFDWDFNWDNSFNHWAGVELNLNGLTAPGGSFSLPVKSNYLKTEYGIKSLSWNLNVVEKDFHIYKNYINLVTGIGFSFNSYQFKNPIRLDPDSSYTYYALDSTINFHKNKLKTSYVQIPLILEFNTSKDPDNAFHIGVGVIGGYKLNSKTIRTYEINGYDFEERRKDDYNINPFKADATVRIGYGPVTLFGTYSLTQLFEPGAGPEVYPFTCGIRIVPFQ